MEATPPPWNILRATWRDLGALRLLEQECFGEEAWLLLDLISVLTLPGVVRLKASAGDQMVGFAAGDRHPNEGCGWVTTLGVTAAYRRRGVARAMLAACEAELGEDRLRLCVRASNLPAIRLYEAEGYRRVDTRGRYYLNGEDALVLEKRQGKIP